MISKYISFSISIAFVSWIVGMIIGFFMRKTAWYRTRLSNLNFISSKTVNSWLGLNAFKWVVKNTFFKFFNQKLKLKQKTSVDELVNLRKEMTNSETDHLFAFVFVTVFAVFRFARFEYLFGSMIIFVNILMNLYPSLLQQENKRRIDQFLARIQRTNREEIRN